MIKQQPLYIIRSHQEEMQSTAQKVNAINPNQLKKLEVLKDSAVVKKYGQAAQYGVVIMTIDDEKYPDAFKAIQAESLKKQN